MNKQPEAYISNGAEEDARKDDMNGTHVQIAD